MAMTLPLTISPSFTSSRLSDSSKSAAKLSSISEVFSDDDGTATMSILYDANNAAHMRRLVQVAAAPLARTGSWFSSHTPTIGNSEGRRKLPLRKASVNGSSQPAMRPPCVGGAAMAPGRGSTHPARLPATRPDDGHHALHD